MSCSTTTMTTKTTWRKNVNYILFIFSNLLDPAQGQQEQLVLTADDEQAITRVISFIQLMGLGFDRDIAIQGYLYCAKDENMAANFLFDS